MLEVMVPSELINQTLRIMRLLLEIMNQKTARHSDEPEYNGEKKRD